MGKWCVEGMVGRIGRDVVPNAPPSSDEASAEEISTERNLNCGDGDRVREQEYPRHIIKFKISGKSDGQSLPLSGAEGSVRPTWD
jgi:hypothetical protein